MILIDSVSLQRNPKESSRWSDFALVVVVINSVDVGIASTPNAGKERDCDKRVYNLEAFRA